VKASGSHLPPVIGMACGVNLVVDEANERTVSAAPALSIDRHYHPQAAALDALVDVLQALLVGDSQSPSPAGQGPTCFPSAPE
jgi:hypothetical protein